ALSAIERFETMFLAEAKLASTLHHPNVCEILDLGDSDGLLYLAMEWVHGDTMAALLDVHEGPLPAAIAARIALDVARGLHAAHEARDERGVALDLVHRDVSPQNILIGLDGCVRISDFGIAKIQGGPTTQAGYVKGKVAYMAPEQVFGEAIDRR